MALVLGTNCGFVTEAPVADPDGGNFLIDGTSLAFKATTPADATLITEIGWWCDTASEDVDFEVGIYEHNVGDDNPEALVDKSAATAKGEAAGWKKVTGLSIAVSGNTIYWIAAQLDDADTATFTNVSADAGEKMDRLTGQTTLINPWGASANTYGNLLAIYAVYTTGGAPEVNVSDTAKLTEDITAQLPLYEKGVSDDTSVAEDVTTQLPLYIKEVSDSVSLAEDVTASLPLYEVNVSESVGVAEDVSPSLPLYEVSVSEAIGVEESVTPQNISANWIGINSAHIDSFCGEEVGKTLAEALDGTDYWQHDSISHHEFVLDLGKSYNITKVRARSNTDCDPTNVDIYVSNNKEDWGTKVADSISTWQDTTSWVEIDTIEKIGRFVWVEIWNTEEDWDFIKFGGDPAFAIFDVYGAVAVITEVNVNVNEPTNVTEDVTAQLPLYEVNVNESIGLSEDLTPQLPLYEIEISDSIGLSESTTPQLYEHELNVSVSESIGVLESITIEQIGEVSVVDAIGVSELVTALVVYLWSNVTKNNAATWTNAPKNNSCTWSNVTKNNSCTWSNV